MTQSYLKQTYLATIRALRKNQHIQLNKDDEESLDKLAKLIEAYEIEPHEFIQFFFKDLEKFYPSIRYLCSPKALQKYTYHQKLKNRYVNKFYAIDGETFYVNRTFKAYPLSQVKGPTSQDPEANYALTTLEKSSKGLLILLQDANFISAVEYTWCKFKYKAATPPNYLTDFLKLVDLASFYEIP